MSLELRPLGSWVLIRPIEQKKTAGGLIIPDSVSDRNAKGKVVFTHCESSLKKDDIVLYDRVSARDLGDWCDGLVSVKEEDILLIFLEN